MCLNQINKSIRRDNKMAIESFEFVSYNVVSKTLRVKFDEKVRDYLNVPSHIYSGLMLNNHTKDFFNEVIATRFESKAIA